MPTSQVTGGIINRHISDGQPFTTIDTHRLDGRILDMQIGDRGQASQGVRSEELGLRPAAIPSHSIPPARTVGVKHSAICAPNGDVFALDLE